MEFSNNIGESKTSIYKSFAMIIACILIVVVIGSIIFLLFMNIDNPDEPQRENMAIKNGTDLNHIDGNSKLDKLSFSNSSKKQSRLKKITWGVGIAGGIAVFLLFTGSTVFSAVKVFGDTENPSCPCENPSCSCENPSNPSEEGEPGKSTEGVRDNKVPEENFNPTEGHDNPDNSLQTGIKPVNEKYFKDIGACYKAFNDETGAGYNQNQREVDLPSYSKGCWQIKGVNEDPFSGPCNREIKLPVIPDAG